MKTEKDLNSEIGKLTDELHEKSQTLTPAESTILSDKIKDLKHELSDLLSKGASKCPGCNVLPMGLLKRAAIMKLGAVESPAIYEVGCANGCRTRMRGNTPKQAVDNWNEEVINITKNK